MILLSNLLDNAIRESEKVLKNTGKAVIHLKLECEVNCPLCQGHFELV